MLNLSPEAGETQGFTTERHIHLLSQHAPGLKVDHFVADSDINTTPGERTHLQRTAQRVGAEITYTDVRTVTADGQTTSVHDPEKLAAALLALGGAG